MIIKHDGMDIVCFILWSTFIPDKGSIKQKYKTLFMGINEK